MTNVLSLTLPAPAKINLFLHILNQRPDGYHNLQTLFQFLDYGDTLTFTRRTDTHISIRPAMDNIQERDNLIYKAAELLQVHSHSPYGVDIECQKKLPIGGGLGGGSSNAASTLLGLNKLWQCQLNQTQLSELGLQLGADVPVFIYGQAAWAEGVGDKLSPLNNLDEPYYLVLNPNIQVHTGRIFSHKDLTRNTPAISIRTALADEGHNDCEPLVRALYPDIDKAMNLLGKFAKAKLTGTGGCVFAAFANRQEAEETQQQMPKEWISFVARGMNISSTQQALSKL